MLPKVWPRDWLKIAHKVIYERRVEYISFSVSQRKHFVVRTYIHTHVRISVLYSCGGTVYCVRTYVRTYAHAVCFISTKFCRKEKLFFLTQK